MKWFVKWFIKQAQKIESEERESKMYGAVPTTKLTSRGSGDVDGDDGLNITVRNANGGRIITFRHYDHKTDRNNYKLYVIPDDHDFEKELGKLITLESMRL